MADPEDEWEYEYDERQTEDFYVTLDLSNVPNEGKSINRTNRHSENPIFRQSRLRAPPVRPGSSGSTQQSPDSLQPSSIADLHVTGLHTENPLISYNGQLLSCNWASSIGTDMIFARPDPNMNMPLRNLPFADLIAVSSTKLMATAARLRPRDEIIDQIVLPQEASVDAMDTTDSNEAGAEAEATMIELPQMSFLEKLNHVKAKRKDKSMLGIVKSSRGESIVSNVAAFPTGKRPQATAATTSATGSLQAQSRSSHAASASTPVTSANGTNFPQVEAEETSTADQQQSIHQDIIMGDTED